MQISKHTFRFKVDDEKQVLLYNPLTGAIDLIDSNFSQLLDSIQDGSEKLSQESLSYLFSRGYAYQTPEDEEIALKKGFKGFKERESKSNLRFVIIPTYQCNSRCTYCFIGDAIGQENLINDDVMDLAFDAMDRIVEERDKGCTIQLSLFGGEPLIDTPSQRRVIERILSMGSERSFQIDIVSNGFDLVHYIDLLRRYGTSKIQVTFDGLREYHNLRRRSVDGRGSSFDRIVAGIDAALANKLQINVRLLLDRNNITSLPQLAAFFQGKQWLNDPNFSVHLGSVFDCFRCQPKKETSNHLAINEGNEILLDIFKKNRSIANMLAIDWQGIRRFLNTGDLFLPTYKTCFGGSRTFAFDLNGGIYICETTAGKSEYLIGTFSPKLNFNKDLIKALDERNIFNIPACKDCPQALLCGGGCAFNAYVEHGSVSAPGCRRLKETIEYGFNYYWPEIKERMELQASSPSDTGGYTITDCCTPSVEQV